MGRLRPPGAFVAVVAALAAGCATASAADTPEQQLAAKHAPVVALKQQDAPCDSDGEPYRPVPADVVLGRRDVRLVTGDGRLIRAAPPAADLFRRGGDTYLDLPGNPLNPGCSYEKWAKEAAAGKPTTAYAHVVGQREKPGTLALQYWFYYPFNDFNNKHESDWEMIQLMFRASSAAEALDRTPTEVGYSQHSGAERADWSDSKLQKRGTHPIVYPGAGSHANYFGQSVWLGHSAQEGFGWDAPREPSRLVQSEPVLLPVEPPASRDAPFAWLAYDGHWGQKASGPNNGPTGPNLKTQWTRPGTWADETWRGDSAAVPLQSTFGKSTTDFFCGAVAYGSQIYLGFLRSPWFTLGLLVAVVALGVWLGRRTTWSPALPSPVDRLRTAGQIYRSAWRIYRRYRSLMLGVGLAFIPLGVLAALVQQAAFHLTGVGTLVDEAESDPLVTGVIALMFGQLSTLAATVLVTGAVAVALGRIQSGERPNALETYRGVVPSVLPLGWAWLRVVVIAGVLAITVVGIPFAIVWLVRKAVVTQACVLEDLDATPALRRSSELVRRHGPRVFAITALVNVTAFLLGPIVGVLALFLTSSSLAVINLISSLVYVVVMPY